MNRRSAFPILAAMALVPLALAPSGRARAQRGTLPGYRPLPGRPGQVRPGQFYGGTNYGAAPGVFTVAGVNTRDNVLKLRDQAGETADVYVSPRMFDLETLKVGDEVSVDFFVGDDNATRLEAAAIYKLERDSG